MTRAPRVYDQDGRLVFARVTIIDGFFARLRGLLGRRPPEEADAWWFSDCSSIHTFGMRFPIDVVHLSSYGVIVRIAHGLEPMRLSRCRGAMQVIELRNGSASSLGLAVGQRLTLHR